MNKGFRIINAADSDTAQVLILADIGGWEGIQDRDLIPEIQALNTANIEVLINSYGGDASQGLSIYNALKDHPANVTTNVMGFACSAASVIAMAGDTVNMKPGSQLMIHDALGGVLGNAADMRSYADVLETISDSIAAIYAEKAGGTAEEWRQRMKAESWFNAEEAKKSGLADSTDGAGEMSASDKAKNVTSSVLNSFKFKNREQAPAPEIFNKEISTEPTPEVDLSALRDALKEAFK